MKTRKAIGFKSLQANCYEINQLTCRCQIIFLENKTYKNGIKQKSEHHHRILFIWNSLGTKIQLKLTILNFRTNVSQKWYFQSKKEHNENHHRALRIRISLSSIFQLQQILLFWNKFLKTRYFQSKTEKINITIAHIRISLDKYQVSV